MNENQNKLLIFAKVNKEVNTRIIFYLKLALWRVCSNLEYELMLLFCSFCDSRSHIYCFSKVLK